MPREAALFELAGGSPLKGYMILKKNGGGNIPPQWVERAAESRRNRHEEVTRTLRKGSVAEYHVLEDWDLAFRKESFYRGIRVLMELERNGKTKL